MAENEVETTVGRALDMMIAEHVLGHHIIRQKKGTLKERTLAGHIRPLRPYSTDIGSAWEIVSRLGMSLIPIEDGRWFALVGGNEGWKSPADFLHTLQSADFLNAGAAVEKTAPLTICLAALKAVEKRQAIPSIDQEPPSASSH